MSVDQLYEFAENAYGDETNHQKIALLLESITDWPVEVQTTDAFFTDVKNYLRIDALTYQEINAKMQGPDPRDSAWRLEALTSLLQIAYQNKDESVGTIIRRLLAE